jgi:hypothetical protein
MRSVRAAIVVLVSGLLASCFTQMTQGTGINQTSWNCTALSGTQYFQGYGASREQAFDSAMQQCKLNAPDSMGCMGDPNKCIPPKGAN